MNDMRRVIEPKSDQINADDLIAGPRTITIREVKIRSGTEQPVSIFFDGDNGKPWKVCKSMSRVLVAAWGPDANNYVGRSVTLYRDPKVKWAGMEVGGIRISHMSHIERDMVMALTETKGKRAPHTVKVMAKPSGKTTDAPASSAPTPVDPTNPPALIQVPHIAGGQDPDWRAWLKTFGAAIDAAPTLDWLNGLVSANQAPIGWLQDASEKQYVAVMAKLEARRVALTDEPPSAA